MSVQIFHSKINDKLGIIIDKNAYYYKVIDKTGGVVKVDKSTIPYEDVCTVINGKFDGDDIKQMYAKGILDTLVGKQYYYKNWYGKYIHLDKACGCIQFVNDFLAIFHRININELEDTEKAFLELLDIYGL
jgi:hypothetical protein